MSIFNSEKIVATLPGILEPDTIYYVRVGEGFDLYCSDSTGTIAHKINKLTLDNIANLGDGRYQWDFSDGTTYVTGDLRGEQGIQGETGKSAFQIAVDYGYSNTEEQWVSSLIFTDSFITLWDTRNTSSDSTLDNQIKLPFVSSGIYDCVIDWGDETQNVVTTWNDINLTHTYTNAGAYVIKISGICRGFVFNNNGDKLKLLNIYQWGKDFRLGVTQGGYFSGCSNLQISALDILNTSDLVSLKNVFRNCSTLAVVPNMNLWNVSNVTNMTAMFFRASSFNQPLDNWNVSNVTNMAAAFGSASSFNQPLDNWNVSNVTSMFQMFSGASSFNQPLNNWNVSNVTNMFQMFRNVYNFNQPLDNWNVSNVTDMREMFESCSNFNQPLNNWNVSNIINMRKMFESCSNFNQPLNNWNVSNVIDMRDFLRNANNWGTQNYSDVLIAWSQLALQSGIVVNFGSNKYTMGVATTARANIISNFNWTIIDGGQA